MTIYTVTPASNLQSAINNAKSGDTIDFTTGTYNISTTLVLKSGLTFLGEKGAILNDVSKTADIMEGYRVSNVSISGLTFENGPQTTGDPSGAIVLFDPNTVSITGNTFSNMQADGDVFVYQGDNLAINNNTFTDSRQAVSLINGQGTTEHNNISVSGNTITNTSRTSIEIQGYYSHMHVDNNMITSNGGRAVDGADAISVVNGVQATPTNKDVSIRGNHVTGGNAAIETAVANATVTGNVLSNAIGGISIGNGSGTNVSGNTFNNVQFPISKDGGYTGVGITVGTNTINGQQVTGWSGGSGSSGSGSSGSGSSGSGSGGSGGNGIVDKLELFLAESGGSLHFIVTADGQQIGSGSVANQYPTEHEFDFLKDLSLGSHDLGITFDSGPSNAHLWVNGMGVQVGGQGSVHWTDQENWVSLGLGQTFHSTVTV